MAQAGLTRRTSQHAKHWYSSSGAAALAMLLVFVVSAVALLVRWRDDFSPFSDIAITELTVREVGHHAVLLGPYSRFHWWHPGPMLWYLLAIPYRLLGSRSIGLGVGAALISGGAAAGLVWTAGTVAGRRLAWWSALVMGVFVWAMGPELLRYPWNPYLTVLPAALVVVLAWAIACGRLWAIPATAVTGTYLVQSHIGYVPLVVAVAVVGGAILLVRTRTHELELDGRHLRRASVLAGALLVVLWAPPLVEQAMHDPGNLHEIIKFFRSNHPSNTLGDGVSTTYGGLGTVVEQVVAHRTGFGVGREMPGWTNILTLVGFAAAVGVAVRRRLVDCLALLALTAVLGLTAVWSVSRIIGSVESYLVQWISIVSPIAWIAIGAVALQCIPRGEDASRVGRRVGTWATAITAAVLALAVLLVGVNSWSAIRALPPDAQITPVARRLERRVISALPRDADDPVLVRIGDQQAWGWAAALVLALQKAHIPVRVERRNGWLISGRLGTDSTDFTRQVNVTLSGQAGMRAAERDPSQRLVMSGSGLDVFVSDRRRAR